MRTKSYYEIQSIAKLKSVLLIIPLSIIYFFVVCIIFLPFKLIFFLYRHAFNPAIHFHVGFNEILIVLMVAFFIAGIQWILARMWGSEIILERLFAKKPDLSDRYHKVFRDVVEEMRIAGGLPAAEAYVIPAWAQNSFALISKRTKPIIAVSEGMVSNLSREELQGVVAHELAHVMRGDSFFIGLIASLTSSIHWFGDMLKPSDDDKDSRMVVGTTITIIAFIYAMVIKAAFILMRLLSCFVSRERELLADATATELTRNPYALASALYKAQLGYNYMGSHAEGYAPIFILAPKILGIDSKDGFWADLFSTHPPIGKRLFNLLTMARRSFKELKADNRKHAVVYDPGRWNFEDQKKKSKSTWFAMNNNGQWMGPFSIHRIMNFPWFNLSCQIRLAEGDPGIQAIPPSVLKTGVRARYLKLFTDSYQRRANKSDFEKDDIPCPVCGDSLDKEHYEGVLVRSCAKCGGKLLKEDIMVRILARKELVFTDDLRSKIRQWRNKWIHTSLLGKRFDSEHWCPMCGLSLQHGPYSYAYSIFVDRCFMCGTIWFDRHELEALQVLVEDVQNTKSNIA